MKILLLDNFDSFTYNLVHLVEQFDDVDVTVVRNDSLDLEEVGEYQKILLSPGPGLPDEAGCMKAIIKKFAGKKDILGVCLGMQAIAEVFGGKLEQLKKVQHGVASRIVSTSESDELFNGISFPFNAGRYHSWMVSRENLPDSFRVTAADEESNIMAFKHQTMPLNGVQFHPESILTEHGKLLISNWLFR